MNMKKIAPAAMSALLFGSALVPVASANEQQSTEAEVPQIQIDPVHIFNDTRGTVEDVRVGENITYYTVKEGEQTNVLEITKDTLVFDNTGKKVELQKGDRVLAYTFANKPQKYIYPPQFDPEVVIVETEEVGFVEVDYFLEDLTNTYDILKLNIAKETVLLNEKGVKVDAKDLAEKHLVVFYTASTKSIPAQTTPSKVIVLDDDSSTTKNPILEEIDNIIASDSYEVAGTKMVPLRVIAEKLGFKVDSTGKGAILSKGNMSYTITRGEKTFGYNKALRTLTVAPTLKETKTYVPVEFVDEYLK
ncbi:MULTISPECIES: copper amine oxidase N-terminal domain-containing protein [Lysinibacillus]|uniref:copper amine oxidase N-terminal domain-containing protein n=1 Tax=Lysinibacillus TaxID=400634 RepID=UPI00214C1279|nr:MULTISPECIES: copper amine oxidase N-terminal domain-containing protein [Lysinibacillus]UUV23763.1 copper amine oxidase N-terminal domain-containing protein [Lysinibacillus sp. FN11]UYB46633.1 copper amine oxidase N-terminal domain-containing protein [Lysinibacillus capsici]WDU78811.1 copper amine oxidase N-terminal domain-containing protein [Lysinibacillus sp. G01H]WHP41353.1 copper amine oxidase N-terminal domain-containing protein [Lysinibacillus boronitolerans]